MLDTGATVSCRAGGVAALPEKTLKMFLAQGAGATILDSARHEVGFLASIWEWRTNRSLYIHLWGRLGNAQRPADQARGMVRSYHPGYVKLSWANPGTVSSPGKPWSVAKPTGGWMGTLGEGEPNTVGRAELMACVAAAESTRGERGLRHRLRDPQEKAG